MNIQEYLSKLSARYKSGISTEHSYRGDLQNLLEALVPNVLITNEPTRVKCGAPDYIITKKSIPIGYIEAKDLGADLSNKSYKEQFDRYRKSLPNLIITNYLDFWLYRNGDLVTKVSLGKTEDNNLVKNHDSFFLYTALIKDFSSWTGQTITSSKKLAEMMAAKARLLSTIIENVLIHDNVDGDTSMVREENITLFDQMKTFKEILIHDITAKEFADIYAQTIAYGMFAARLHDPSLSDFSRQEAGNLIPKTNPFLRKLFQYIAGYDLDSRIVWIVDALADIFRATDVGSLLKNFGSTTQKNDPIIHFYETFLSEYDPALRKARGVWFTPEPIVNFIVRAVDDILKTEFQLKQGLADSSKIKIKVKVPFKKTADRTSKIMMVDEEVEVHKLQILDPACGTGTFLSEIIKHIYNRFKLQQGIWSGYVEKDLIPRLNGFELLMASYAMAHLKMDLLLSETGFITTNEQRFKIFLTNSLEEFHPETGTLFSSWLSDEANQANKIKRDTPVMVVVGNPPYSVSSSNKSPWIEKLIEDYKKDLNERNIQPLSDDYIKFIRFGQEFIDKNGSGVLAYITNNSFIDGLIHRQMRKDLLESFDTIYVLDLHGNSKKGEESPDGSIDQNVFDIMQGVSINLFIKTGKKQKTTFGKVKHYDLFGKREYKYDFLSKSDLASIKWQTLEFSPPNYYFIQKDFKDKESYERGFKIEELFGINSSGVKTHRDHFVIDFYKESLSKRIKEYYDHNIPDNLISDKFHLKDNSDFSVSETRKSGKFDHNKITDIDYRPFDKRSCYYETSLIDRNREKVMKHFLHGENLGLIVLRQSRNKEQGTFWITNSIVGKDVISALDTCTVFPLYLYLVSPTQSSLHSDIERIPNLKPEILTKICEAVGLEFVAEKEINSDNISPIDILDYLYAILYSFKYREKYREFLKIDFPRIPYPKGKDMFLSLVHFGCDLRELHLLSSPRVEKFITSYPINGDNEVVKPKFEIDTETNSGRVWINKTQYFDCVPEEAWNYFIGGYQPLQRWLKDRIGHTLNYEDVLHYQKIVVSITETKKVMIEIDKLVI